MRRLSAAVAVAALVALPAAVPAASDRPATAQLLAQFEAVAFGSEFGPGHDRVWRWNEDLRIAVTADRPPEAQALRQALAPHMAAIARLTGLQVRHEPVRARANVDAVLADRAAFAARAGRWPLGPDHHAAATAISACMAFLSVRNQHIYWAGLLYGADLPPLYQRDCLLEELVQAMGLPNDACHYRPSLFCPDDLVDRLQGADAILLRTLYDPRLTPEMPRHAAMPVAAMIIRELWEPGAEPGKSP